MGTTLGTTLGAMLGTTLPAPLGDPWAPTAGATTGGGPGAGGAGAGRAGGGAVTSWAPAVTRVGSVGRALPSMSSVSASIVQS